MTTDTRVDLRQCAVGPPVEQGVYARFRPGELIGKIKKLAIRVWRKIGLLGPWDYPSLPVWRDPSRAGAAGSGCQGLGFRTLYFWRNRHDR